VTLDELKAIEHADERAQAAQVAVTNAREFGEAAIVIRDEALREMRRGGMSYGAIADMTGVGRSAVIAVTRHVNREAEQTELST